MLPALAQNSPFDQLTNNSAGAGISPQDACDYIIKLLKDWDRDHPQPTPATSNGFPQNHFSPLGPGGRQQRFTQTDIDNLANQYATVGTSNLIVVIVTIDNSGYLGTLQPLLTQALWKALNQTIKDADLSQCLNAAPYDPAVLSFIMNREQWRTQDRVVTFIQNEMDRISGHSGSTSPLGQIVSLNVDLPSSSDGKSLKDENANRYFFKLIETADKSGNTALTYKLMTLFQDVGQNGADYNYPTLRTMLHFCLSQNPAYRKFVPNVLTAVISKSDHTAMDTQRTSLIEQLSSFCLDTSNSVFCGNPHMQDAIHQLAAPALQDSNPNFVLQANCLVALVGDQDSFKYVFQKYSSDKGRHNLQASIGIEESLLRSIVYQGPTDWRQAIIDNVDLCKFDSAQGRWILTVPGSETQTPITNGDFPVQPN